MVARGQVAISDTARSGLLPVTSTFFANLPGTLNNSNTKNLGVSIARNGNVAIGWEDDGAGLSSLNGAWTLFDHNGNVLSKDVELRSKKGGAITTHFNSFFRTDGSPTPNNAASAPKLKANLFGDGFGFGATAKSLGEEIPELLKINQDAGGLGDFPVLQLLQNSGAPKATVSAVSDADANPSGGIQLADWEYLSTGSIVVVSTSSQNQDLVTRFGGSTAGSHVFFKIIWTNGLQLKGATLASETATPNDTWHGIGVTKEGFAIRFSENGRTFVRLFDNSGEPKTGNLDLGNSTGFQIAGQGGRGENTGFHGNGVDAYISVNSGVDPFGAPNVWMTIINTNGFTRLSKMVSDDVKLNSPLRADAAIDSLGRMIVVYDDVIAPNSQQTQVLGRVFDSHGIPLGGTFSITDQDNLTRNSQAPRVALRNDTAAIVWQNQESSLEAATVAARLFAIDFKPGSLEGEGLKRIVPDTVLINQNLDSLENWEPYASVLGTSTFLIEGNAFAEGTTDKQRYVVALQSVDGGPKILTEGFYSDGGSPYNGVINASRQDGNPGRVAGDPRPGASNFIVGGEASPHLFSAFGFDDRWKSGYDRLSDGRYGTIQTFQADTHTATPVPLSKAQDAANGRVSGGRAPGNEITRFGGDMVGLDDGNFLVVIDDRSRLHNPNGNGVVAVVVAPDGKIVTESFLVAKGDIWSNVAAFKGGFAVRVAGEIYFHDNAGKFLGKVDQDTSGEPFDRGRGDGTRIAGHINSPYVFLAGKVSNASVVRLAVWDSRNRQFLTATDVSEGGFRGEFDRATLSVDALNRVVVAWVSRPENYEDQQVVARVFALDGSSFNPLTGSFLPFINSAPVGGITSSGMSLAMTTRQILVAAKGRINLNNEPNNGANSTRQINFYTVIAHPNPADDPTVPIGGIPSVLRIRSISDNGSSITLNWDGPGTIVQQRTDPGSGLWVEVVRSSTGSATVPKTGKARFFRIVGP